MVNVLAPSAQTQAAILDLSTSGRFTAEQLTAIRLLIVAVVITREKHRTLK
jgi:hypothetical protein